MKIIHTADLHLNSALTTRFNTTISKKIRDNVFLSLEKLTNFAKENQVEVVVIAGDLFDNDKVSFIEQEKFKNLIANYKDIKFIFVFGNHDQIKTNQTLNYGDNFITLAPTQTITIKNVTFSGIDFTTPLPENFYNIVVAHGDITKDIPLTKLRNKNIDYLALGHIHQNQLEKLDERGVYSYCGSLASRGFDECGQKGFYLIDTHSTTYVFKPINNITFNCIKIDVTEFTDIDFYAKLTTILPPQNTLLALKVTLYGENSHLNIDLSYLKEKYSGSYLYVDFIDETSISVIKNSPLISEFLKVVELQNYPQEDKEKIIKLGINVLK